MSNKEYTREVDLKNYKQIEQQFNLNDFAKSKHGFELDPNLIKLISTAILKPVVTRAKVVKIRQKRSSNQLT